MSKGTFILGPNVRELEREMAIYVGVDYAIGVASGTDALILTLRAMGVGRGDEVIVRDTLLYGLHRQGYAKEYNTHGSFARALRWRHGRPVPWEQYDPWRP